MQKQDVRLDTPTLWDTIRTVTFAVLFLVTLVFAIVNLMYPDYAKLREYLITFLVISYAAGVVYYLTYGILRVLAIGSKLLRRLI